MIDANLEMTDKIGYLLLKKGIIDIEVLEKALRVKQNENGKLKRNLAQILVEDFNFDHDSIFRQVAILYAFRELNIKVEEIPDNRIDEIKRMITNASDEVKNQMLEHKIIPFQYDERVKDKLILAAIDPTDKSITRIAYGLNAKKYEVSYIRKKDYLKLIQIVLPPENEFLKQLEEQGEELTIEAEEGSLDEDALESEINKSALISLVEGSLVEGVRRDASDIHYVPKSGNKTEIYFRVDGDLKLWFVQDNVWPEAVISVVKSKNGDRTISAEVAVQTLLHKNLLEKHDAETIQQIISLRN